MFVERVLEGAGWKSFECRFLGLGTCGCLSCPRALPDLGLRVEG